MERIRERDPTGVRPCSDLLLCMVASEQHVARFAPTMKIFD